MYSVQTTDTRDFKHFSKFVPSPLTNQVDLWTEGNIFYLMEAMQY